MGRGGTINTMVLAGLVIALGEVVDDAIIDVENIMRRLRLNRPAGNPRSLFQVVLDASPEVRSVVLYGSLIIALRLSLLIILCLPGYEIEHPMAVVILGGLLTSAIMNLLFMPALYWKFGKVKS